MGLAPSSAAGVLGLRLHAGRARRSRLLQLLLLAVLLFTPLDAHAQPPALTALYAVSDVTPNNDEVSLILTIGLRNDGEQPLLNAHLLLENADVPDDAVDVDPDLVFGSFDPFDLDPRGALRVSRRFTLPAHEYDRWLQGNHPCIRLVFDDAEALTPRRLTLTLVFATHVPDNPLAF
jgi:hypothetical protein